MTRIFDALRRAESTKPHGTGPASITPLPAPVPHAGGAARAVAANPRSGGVTYRGKSLNVGSTPPLGTWARFGSGWRA